MVKQLKQLVGKLPMNCFSVFYHLVGLELNYKCMDQCLSIISIQWLVVIFLLLFRMF